MSKDIAKNILAFRGILNTSIVKYQDKKIAPNAESSNEKEKGLSSDSNPNIGEVQVSTIKNISFGRIFDNKEAFFSVQIGTFKNYVPSSRLEEFQPVYYELIEGDLIRYISGKFKTFNEAKKMKFKITSKGIQDAFIVKYTEGVRYSLPKN